MATHQVIGPTILVRCGSSSNWKCIVYMADGVANDPSTRMLMANSETFRNEAQNIPNMTEDERVEIFC